MPLTGGGITTPTKASSIANSFICKRCAMAPADSALPLRLACGSSVAKMTPLLEAMPKPAVTDKPENEMMDSTPFSADMMSVMRRITASVRSMDAESGSCAKAMT